MAEGPGDRGMKPRRSVAAGLLRYSFSALPTLFLFALLILCGRYLGAADFGVFSFALALGLIFDPVLDPGLYHLLIREIARDRGAASQYMSHALAWKGIAAPLVMLAIAGFVNFTAQPLRNELAIYLLITSCIFKSIKDVFRSALIAYEYFTIDVLSIANERFLLLIIGMWALLSGKGLYGICAVFVIIRAIDLLVIIYFVCKKIGSFWYRLDISFLKSILWMAIPIGAYYVTLNTYNYVDTVMLSMLRSAVEVGWYNASYKIYEGLLILPVIVTTVLMPRLSSVYREEPEAFRLLVSRGLKYVFLLSVFIALNGYLAAKVVMYILFGDEYIPSTDALVILLVGILACFSISFVQTVLISVDKQKISLFTTIAGLIINILLNYWLIEYYGHIGAALATVIAEFLVFVVLIGYCIKYFVKISFTNIYMKPLCIYVFLVTMAKYFMVDMFIVLKMILVNAAALAALFLWGYLDAEERRGILAAVPMRLKGRP
jgi:O-antigen/teichoic acid export membrane protein